jgi:hypothetical protein
MKKGEKLFLGDDLAKEQKSCKFLAVPLGFFFLEHELGSGAGYKPIYISLRAFCKSKQFY